MFFLTANHNGKALKAQLLTTDKLSRLKTNSKSCSCVVFMCSATHIMLGTGEKKLLNRHNRAQRVAAAKQLLVPAVTSDSASLNVKVTCIFLFVTLQSMFAVHVICNSLCKSQIPLHYLFRSWSQTGSKPNSITLSCLKLVQSWLHTGRTCLRPALNQLA